SFIISENKIELLSRLQDFLDNPISEEELKLKYGLGKNYAKWIIENKKDIKLDEYKIVPFSYRPFDDRLTYFDNKLIWRWRYDINKHLIKHNNLGLVMGRQSTDDYWCNVQVSKNIIDNRYHFSYKGTASHFPLYLYRE